MYGAHLCDDPTGRLEFWREGLLPFADPKFFEESKRRLKRERQKAHKKWEMGN